MTMMLSVMIQFDTVSTYEQIEVTVTYISWVSDFVILVYFQVHWLNGREASDYESVGHSLLTQNKYRLLLPIMHGLMILFYISMCDNINIILFL